ncbi:MAG: outer membrane beta-barrel protein [Gammaproteobacteria bacterium]
MFRVRISSSSSLLLVLAVAISVGVPALAYAADESAPERPYGRLFRTLFGNTLEQNHQVAVLGFAHVSASATNHSIQRSNTPQGKARNIQPQGGVLQDTGLNLQHVGLLVCKGAGCPPGRLFDNNRNVLSRVSPLPGPRGEHIIVDWAVSALYGEDGVFWTTKGLDDFEWNADDAHRLAITQWYLDIYLPWADGVSLLIGSWHSPLAAEIGYPFVPPNLFASRSHAFLIGPSKHLGALAQIKLPIAPQWGLWSVSLGVVSDWNSVDFGGGAGGPSFMLGLSWRSQDMRTWLDIETLYGNGEDDFGDAKVINNIPRPLGGGSQFLALSSTNEYLERFISYVVVSHAATPRLDIISESVYGFQEGGDLAPSAIAITQDSAFYGTNLGFRYKVSDRWHVGARIEWFRDEDAANVLWSAVGASGGDVYALTTNVTWHASPHLRIRPELKFDAYDGGGKLFAPNAVGIAQKNSQLLGVVNFEFGF